MSALQGQVDQWFTDNPNATGQQIVDVIKSVGGLDAHAGLTDILASRYGVAPNEVQNYYNIHAAPASSTAAVDTGATGALSQVANTPGLGVTGIGTSNAANAIAAEPSNVASVYKSIYGVDPDAGTLTQLSNRFGPTFDPSEVAGFVYDDTSLRDDPRGAVKTLQQQILDQGTTSRWSGEGFGSAQANAADMARMLASAGITDINQFGVRQVERPGEPVYDDSGNITSTSPAVTVPEYFNKATGVALDPRYDKAGKNNAWSGTFAGEGSTAYKVQIQPDGTPYFYTQYGGSSNDLAQLMEDPLIGAIVQGAASYFGGPLGTAALNLAAGRDIDDVAKATLASFVAGEVGKTVSGAPSVVDTLGKTGADVLGRVAGSVATGGGEEGALQALLSGGINAAMPEIQTMIPGYSNLPPFGKEFVNNAIASTLRDGNLSEQDLIRAAVRAGTVAARTSNTDRKGALAPVEDMGPTSFGTNTTGPLADAGEGDVLLPSGIQTASLDGGLPFRAEVGGLPIYAEDPRSSNIRPPAGYTLASKSDPASDERVRYDDNDRILPRSDGSYFDVTQNAWFKPTGEFDAATNVQDYSNLFGGSQSNLTDADLAAIRGGDAGLGENADFDYTGGLSGGPTRGVGGLDFAGDNRPPADDLGTIEIVDKRPNPVYDYGEPNPVYDYGEPNPEYDYGEPISEDGSVDTPTTTTPTTTTPTTTTPRVTTPTTPVRPTVASQRTTNQPSFDASITTTPQFLRGAAREKAMKLAALRQLFDSLTPEMQEILMERGITAPPEQEPDEKSEKESPEQSAEQYSTRSNDASVTTRFAATGGPIKELREMKDTFNPNLKTVGQYLAAAPVDTKESPLKLISLRHLRQSIAKPPRSMDTLAQGGLPQKYAKAAPKGHNPEFITGLTGYYASGKGTGQSDDIPAMLHDGDYVIDADAVAALGDGSSKAGAQALSQLQSKIPHSMSSGGSAVPAKIADGEYVFPEAFVTALGGGDNKQGAKLLDAMREELRAHKRSAPTSKIPPKAKSPLDYLRMAKG